MTNTESKQQYEGAILQQLIKNAERLVIVEQDITQLKEDGSLVKKDVSQLKEDMEYVKLRVGSIDKTLGSVKWVLVTIALAIIANIFSQPILAWLNL